ncbi:MAG TPA: hypothetical protein PLZ93_07465 [Nocardioides sp.]|uniref:hypothetical protein n=1 Tax=uncultured Nocardioides sp. TaxID=198441 RepID=UPI000ECA5BE5|nr:hypothetical protein [uncultured Nocardioides sp.]HCB03554.1 hypothetical protein [Nocardioides sp.]HRD61159.1 hypothetical protein [Nocardioides sp.]HRI95435.1 hypothetical protein [Nocardioides sp.]HRK45684.1 hypothetical protein [Nocardioides sp.]
MTASATHAQELRREAYTMALYVAVCLLAALIAAPHDGVESHAIGIIWGVTVGLALAHWFAFRVSAMLVSSGQVHARDVELAGAQLAGAAVVAAAATVAIVVVPDSWEIAAVEFLLAALIAGVGFVTARSSGASGMRAAVYAVIVLAFATGIALLKNLLAGH